MSRCGGTCSIRNACRRFLWPSWKGRTSYVIEAFCPGRTRIFLAAFIVGEIDRLRLRGGPAVHVRDLSLVRTAILASERRGDVLRRFWDGGYDEDLLFDDTGTDDTDDAAAAGVVVPLAFRTGADVLVALGLEHLVASFLAHDVDEDSLSLLGSGVLDEVGVPVDHVARRVLPDPSLYSLAITLDAAGLAGHISAFVVDHDIQGDSELDSFHARDLPLIGLTFREL